jgi:hypothetical protein
MLGSDLAKGNYKTASQKLISLGQITPAITLMKQGQEMEADAKMNAAANGGVSISSLGGAGLTPSLPTINGDVSVPGAPVQMPGATDGALPRGLRNNNPGNIEAGSFTQSQPGYAGSDGRFARFDTLEHGVGAQSALLGSYGNRGINTVAGVVNRWAPQAENGAATGNYANFVARKLGVGANDPINLGDPATRQRVALAMGEFENGRPIGAFGAQAAPARVADASGGIPASVGAAPAQGQVDNSDAQRAQLNQRYLYLNNLLQNSPGISEHAQNRVKTAMEGIKFQLGQLDKQGTDAQRNYELARRQGYTGSFMDYQAATKGGTTVNVGPNEGEFAKKAAGKLSDRFAAIVDEGDTARNDLALVSQLRDLGGVIQTGGPAALQGWLAERGIKVGANVGDVEAYQAIVDKLTPSQRVPGSGTTSDRDMAIFKSSLPSLIKTPEGNAIVQNVLSALAQSKIDRAGIAERVLTGEISAKDGVLELRKLPNPFEAMKGGNAQATPQTAEGKTNLPAPPASELSEFRAALNQAKTPQMRDAIVQRFQQRGAKMRFNTNGLGF